MASTASKLSPLMLRVTSKLQMKSGVGNSIRSIVNCFGKGSPIIFLKAISFRGVY